MAIIDNSTRRVRWYMPGVGVYDLLHWMTERQAIYKRRCVDGDPPPWTDDPILRKYHFCNCYRELDAGTQYLLDEIMGQGDQRDVFFNVVFYRVLNRPESYEAAGGFTPVSEWNADAVVSQLKAFGKSESVFSPAYRVSAHKFVGSDSKVENVVYGILDELHDNIEDYYQSLVDAEDMETAHTVLQEIPGVGGFLAYELVTDLAYGFLDAHENDFVHIGPGAERGMERIWDIASKDHIYWLRENQEDLFDRYDLDFFYWNGWEEKRLTLRDFEHSLCEWNKYRRVEQGGGNVRRFEALPGAQLEMTEFV